MLIELIKKHLPEYEIKLENNLIFVFKDGKATVMVKGQPKLISALSTTDKQILATQMKTKEDMKERAEQALTFDEAFTNVINGMKIYLMPIITAINEFFDVNNWDFGDRFYLGELITYITNSVAPDLSNLVIVPRQPSQTFGSLFEIQSRNDEIFVSGATVDDIVIVSSITASEIRVDPTQVVSSVNNT
jgi:hypothetical protein